MSELIYSLDLAKTEWFISEDTLRSSFGYVSLLLQKPPGACDDEFYARNLWPCRDKECNAVLAPLDRHTDWGLVMTVEEIVAKNQRCCPACGTFRMKRLCIYDLLELLTNNHVRRERNVRRRTW